VFRLDFRRIIGIIAPVTTEFLTAFLNDGTGRPGGTARGNIAARWF